VLPSAVALVVPIGGEKIAVRPLQPFSLAWFAFSASQPPMLAECRAEMIIPHSAASEPTTRVLSIAVL
jgi:hypothetical protein